MTDDMIVQNLEEIKALLKIMAIQEFQKLRSSILSTRNKVKIFELCDGELSLNEIAEKVNVSSEAVRLTIKDFDDVGIIIIKRSGKKWYPRRVL